MGRFIALDGQKFGKLKVLSVAGKNKKGNYTWLCLCDCGKQKRIASENLRTGHITSCGNPSHKEAHGMWKSRFYRIWCGVKRRCSDLNNKNYGSRGITLCDRWLKFENFRDDMYKSYLQHCKKHGEKNTSIERKNNDKGYSPENCTWATRKEQNRNHRRNRIFTYQGKSQCLTDWVKELNMNRNTLNKRMYVMGWTFERAVTTPIKQTNH